MKKHMVFVIFILIGVLPLFSQNMVTLDNAINDYATGLLNYIQRDKGVAVIAFETDNVVLSEYFIDTMTDKLWEKGIRPIFERQRLEILQNELNYSLSGEVSDETAIRIGHRTGVNTLVYGTLRRMGNNNYRINIRATNVETAQLVYPRSYDLQMDTRLSGLLGTSAVAINTPSQNQTAQDNFIFINGGTFSMGSPYDELGRRDDEVKHNVTVNSFYMGKYSVTQLEYQRLMVTNPSHFLGNNLPVEMVSWYDAIEYCNRLSQLEGLTPAYIINKNLSDPNNLSEDDPFRWLVTWNRSANGYRLPTEAEWEYACRAGTATPYNTGNSISVNTANFYDINAGSDRIRGMTTPVGSYAPNPWGLYDMHGNVLEWCWDWYGAYSYEAQVNPQGVSRGDHRILRGGDWRLNDLRSAARWYQPPQATANFSWSTPWAGTFVSLGFRVVRNAD